MPFIEYESREEWVKSFGNRLGASEIGIVCGVASYKTPQQLWQEKVGKKKAADLSENELVSYGTAAEEHLRALFALKHRNKYEIEYHPLRVYYSENEPYLTATLDGEIIEKETGRRGIYECKTCMIQSKAEYEEWANNHIPQKYYCQLCQQFYVTGFDFAILNAELRWLNGRAEINEYPVERIEVENDIQFVREKGAEFWRYVTTRKSPPVKITI